MEAVVVAVVVAVGAVPERREIKGEYSFESRYQQTIDAKSVGYKRRAKDRTNNMSERRERTRTKP